MAKSKADEKADIPVEEKLTALFELQQIDTQIDKIKTIRGELPLEVRDLEDAVTGMEVRVNNLKEEIVNLETYITDRKNAMKESAAAIKKYEGQQGKVRNNREYDSISKEIEYQNLEIQLSEKKIKEAKANIIAKNELIEGSADELKGRKKDLKIKKEELDDIIAETQKEKGRYQRPFFFYQKTNQESLKLYTQRSHYAICAEVIMRCVQFNICGIV
jgi:predicted  nucleic acid-binding Zn-ribbon protein